MKSRILGLLLLLLMAGSMWAQSPSDTLRYRKYQIGIDEGLIGGSVLSLTLKTHVNYLITPHFSVGGGVGLQTRTTLAIIPVDTNIPVFATFRYYPSKAGYRSRGYFYTDLGYEFQPEKEKDDFLDDPSEGYMGEIGWGWQHTFGRRLGVNFQVGLHIRQFKYTYQYERGHEDDFETSVRSGQSLSAGIFF